MRLKVGFVESIAAACVIAVFVHLGNWQAGKASRQRELQAQLDQRSHESFLSVGSAALDPVADVFRPVTVRGQYLPEYQILLDNQVLGDRAGYHVLTPLRIEATSDLIVVNRGWVPASPSRNTVPALSVPTGPVEIRGELVTPPKPRYLAQAPPQALGKPWPTLWQAVDVKDLESRLQQRVAPLFVQLDPNASGGYERRWPRLDARVGMHQSYAYQWYGLAILVGVIYGVTAYRRSRAGSAAGRSTQA